MDLIAQQAKRFSQVAAEIDRAHSVRDVAAMFGVSERQIWRLIKSGDLQAERLGARCVRIFDSEIAQFRTRMRG